MEHAQWEDFVDCTFEYDTDVEQRTDQYLVHQILDIYYLDAINVLASLINPESKIDSTRREILIQRWTQIQKLIQEVLQNTKNPATGLELAVWSKFC